MGKKTPPCENYPQWTDAAFWAFLRAGLRAKWMRWPPKWQALHAASRPYKGSDKRKKTEYKCAHCGKWFSQKDVSVDHIIPTGSLRKWDDLVPFVQRLFCSIDNLQVLCKSCHDKKTYEEKYHKDS